MQALSWHNVDSIVNFLFESENIGQEGGNLQKSAYFKNQKGYLDDIKSIFHSF